MGETRDDAGVAERALSVLGIAKDGGGWHWTHANGNRHQARDAADAAAALLRSYQLNHDLAESPSLRAVRYGLRKQLLPDLRMPAAMLVPTMGASETAMRAACAALAASHKENQQK